jgi:hypothetical protein
MAEERPRRIQPDIAGDQQDDVLDKIDQLLNRHRSSAAVPAPKSASLPEDLPGSDGIPVLTDMVAGPGQSALVPPARPGTINSALILRRLAAALEAEQARLLAQIGSDETQAGMLERLVAELKRSLPAAVRAAIAQSPADPDQPGQ